MRVGRPTAFRCASTRTASCPEHKPRSRENRNARRHADGDALAVHEPRWIVVGQILQGMAESVPKIEQRALSLLRFVGDDDARLGCATDRDRFGARRSAREYVAPIRLQKLEKAAVVDEPILDDLSEAGAEIALAQGIETSGVGQHQRRLMKGADEVFSVPRIDSRLAAHARVDLSEQRRRDLNQRTPRRRVAAQNPARSPMTPPPSAMTTSRRSMRASISASATRANSA